MIAFRGVTAKPYKHYFGLLGLCAALLTTAAAADPAPAEPAAVDLSAARTLLLSQVPEVPWLLHEPTKPVEHVDLATIVKVQPAESAVLEANSEQRQPLQLGATLRDQVFYKKTAPVAKLPLALKALAERQALWVLEHLHMQGKLADQHGLRGAEFELWPTQNEVGRLTWVIARFRTIPLAGPPQPGPKKEAQPGKAAPEPAAWQWIDAAMQRDFVVDPDLIHDPQAILPEHLSPASRRGFIAIFRDFLAADTRDLYEKPSYSECVWLNADKTAVLAAWRPSDERPAQRAYFEKASEQERRGAWCVAMPQPARLDQKPLVFHLRVTERVPGPNPILTQFAEPIEWAIAAAEHPVPHALRQSLKSVRLPAFPPSFDADFRRDVAMLSGEAPLPSGLRLVRKSSADPQHQLEALFDELEARYKKLGLVTRRQRFTWRGIPQSNLIAVLPAAAGAKKPPIVLADHVDSAFCEDIFARSDKRVSAPGADDNSSATAALLRAAEALRTIPESARQHEIWLLHLTGEEYPSDDLGARRFIEERLQSKTDIGALFILDMIGSNPRNHPEYQLNAGGYADNGVGGMSLRLAQVAAILTPRVAQTLRPVIYPMTDLRSYLYNTDGVVFAEAGFPIVHISEVMNRYNLSRLGYHDSLDTLVNLNVGYAAAIARVAISTVAALSQLGLPVPTGL